MVHTRHSYSKDIEHEVNPHVKGKGGGDVLQNGEDGGIYCDDDKEASHVEDVRESNGLEHVHETKTNKKENKENKGEVSQPRKKRRALISMYENFAFDETIHRRSLRNLTRSQRNRNPCRVHDETNKQNQSCYDDGPRKRSKSYGYKDYGTLVIRRSDRQPKKVFESFNESEIQRSIEKKHQEILELQQASMYDSIKRRRGEISETQEDTEEDEEEQDESEEEEDESEEEEEEDEEEEGSQKGYSLRQRKPQTKIYQAASKRSSRSYAGPRSPLHKRPRIKKVPQHSSSSPYKRRSYKRMRRSSSTSCSSDEEAGFERRKEKSMAMARARCLPMNFHPEDITGTLKSRDQARGGVIGGSLADVDPMTIDTKTSFSDIGGLDHHIQSLKEMVVFPLLYPEVFQKFSIAPPRGVLFYGPPGTGKTLVARALANECSSEGKKVAFFMRKGADCLSKWVGESERQLRLLFDQAYCMRPSIIFFDEIDGIAPVRSTRQDQIHSSIVSTLLALMDGLDSRGEIVVIGATNRLDSIDPALRRPGRFDREFLFTLPNKPAREKILEIHTSSWQPKLSKEFMFELAEKCVGYCGADIKALCTEAALFALRRRYPQIYKTNKKLVLDMNQIKLSIIDFKNALRAITPASHRSKTTPGRVLPEQIRPLLERYVEQGIKYLHKIFPQGKPVQDDVFKQSRNDDANNLKVNIFEKTRSRSRSSSNAKIASFFSSNQKMLCSDIVNRPRLLIHGPSGNGQASHVAPALIFSMEHLTTHTLDLPSLFGNSAKTPEEAISTVFREARRTSPSIIYLPRVEIWWQSVGETTRATFCTLLDDIPSTIPVLLIASADIIYDDLPEPLRHFFSPINQELLEMSSPGESDRYEYFKGILLQYALKIEVKPDRNETPEELEVLKEASPPKPRELSSEESKNLLDREEATFRELRLFLRQVTWKLLADRKFKEFFKPVDLEEVDDYLDVIKEPMDLSTVMTRINSHHYHSCAHYLKDIDLIVNNCLEYNPDKDQFDKLLRNRACEMRDVAHALIHNDLNPDFEKLCLEIHEAREKRGFDYKVSAPSFIKVMPKFSKAAANISSVEAQASTAEKPSIPSPVGSRFSRRVRGIAEPIDPNMLEQIEKRNRQKNPIKNNAIGVVDNEQEDISHENEPTLEEHDLATNGNLTEDETHDSGDSVDAGDIRNAKQSLNFNGANEVESCWAAQAEHLLTELVSRTADYKVNGLEQIYTQLCRIIGAHRYEENRSLVLQELKTFIGVLR